jgi:hypothetical protein
MAARRRQLRTPARTSAAEQQPTETIDDVVARIRPLPYQRTFAFIGEFVHPP